MQIDVNCDHYRGGNGNRIRRQSGDDDGGTYVVDVQVPVEM